MTSLHVHEAHMRARRLLLRLTHGRRPVRSTPETGRCRASLFSQMPLNPRRIAQVTRCLHAALGNLFVVYSHATFPQKHFERTLSNRRENYDFSIFQNALMKNIQLKIVSIECICVHGRNGVAPLFAPEIWRTIMINRTALTLVAATVAALCFAAPAFAQSFDPDAGTGNVRTFGYAPVAGSQRGITRPHSGLEAYARIPKAGDDTYAPRDADGGTFSYLMHGRL